MAPKNDRRKSRLISFNLYSHTRPGAKLARSNISVLFIMGLPEVERGVAFFFFVHAFPPKIKKEGSNGSCVKRDSPPLASSTLSRKDLGQITHGQQRDSGVFLFTSVATCSLAPADARSPVK